jgi:hypothetical protein
MAEQEVKPCEFVSGACIHCEATERENCEGWICPPQREWVGLTDEEMSDIVADMDVDFGDLLWKVICLTKIIEATLKERNT